MATLWRSFTRNRCYRIRHSCSLLQNRRHAHTETLWEQLLGRKVEPALAEALEKAYVDYTVSQSVPSWLPFSPNSSFWIPSSEDTLKRLEDLSQHLQDSPSVRPNVFKRVPEPQWHDTHIISRADACSSMVVADKLLDIHVKSPKDKGEILLVNRTDSENEATSDEYEYEDTDEENEDEYHDDNE